MSISIRYISLILILLISSCKTKQIGTDRPPMIIFLNYDISKDSDGEIKVDFINKIISEGRLKKDLSQEKSFAKDDIICIQNNSRSKPIQSMIIPNPFVKRVESIDDSGRLYMKLIEVDSTQISIRMQLNPLTKFIILEQMNKPNKRLIKTKI